MRPARALALVLALAFLAGCLGPGLTGRTVPAFDVVTSDGAHVTERTYAGQFVVVELMATWCGPCQREVEELKAVQAAEPDRVRIVTIGIDPSADSEADVDRFEQAHNASWPHGLDRNGSVARALGLRAIPKLLVIDPDGVVVLEASGVVVPAAEILRTVRGDQGVTDLADAAPAAALALLVGFLATLSPLDASSAEPRRRWRALGVIGLLAGALLLARGALAAHVGFVALVACALTLGAAVQTRGRSRGRGRRSGPTPTPTPTPIVAWLPHFALAIVLAAPSPGAIAFAAPAIAFVAGAALGIVMHPILPARGGRGAIGWLGVALVAAGLLIVGLRGVQLT